MFQEIKRLLKHSLVYGSGSVLRKVIGFLMIPVYTRYLTPTDYGVLELMELAGFVVMEVMALGLSWAIFRFYHYYDNPKDKDAVISTAIISSCTCSLICLIILLNFKEDLSEFVCGTKIYSSLFMILFCALFMRGISDIPFAFIRVKEKSTFFTIISILELLLGVSLNIYFVVLLKIGIVGILYSKVVVHTISAVILIPLTLKGIKIKFEIKKLKEMLAYSMPLIPANFAMYILHFIDRFFLKRFSTLHIVGLYALGYKFGMVVSVLILEPFLLIWSAAIFDISKRKNAKQIYAKILTYFAFVMIFLGLSISVLIKDVLKIITTPEFFEAYKIVPLIIFSYIFLGLNYCLDTGIRLEKKTKWLPIISWITAGANLLLSWLLIPRYAMMGAGYVKIASFSLMTFITLFISNRLYYIPYEFSRILKMFLVGGGIYLLSFLVYSHSLLISISLKGLLLLSFFIVLYYLNFYTDEEKNKLKEILNKYNIKGTKHD